MEMVNTMEDIESVKSIEKELNLFNEYSSSDFDDDQNDETYTVSQKDLFMLRSDQKEDVPNKKDKKVSCNENFTLPFCYFYRNFSH